MAYFYPGVPLTAIKDIPTRNAMRIVDTYLRQAQVDLAAAGGGGGGGGLPDEPYIVATLSGNLTSERNLEVAAPISISDGGANAPITIGATMAAPTITFAATAAAGATLSLIHSDAVLRFPQALMPASGGTDTLTLTQSGVDLTLTSSNSGPLNIRAAGDILSLPKWTAGAEGGGTPGIVLSFNALGSSLGGAILFAGLQAQVALNEAAATYTGDLYGGQFDIDTRGGPTYTGAQAYGMWGRARSTASHTGTHSFDRRAGVFAELSNPKGASVTVTDSMQVYGEDNTATLGTAGTYVNGYASNLIFPRTGSTIRRGYNLRTQSANVGTEPTDTEGFYCETLQKGTTRRTGFAFDGATTGTPTDAYGFRQMTVHGVGTNRYGLNTLNAGVIENPSGVGQNVLTLNQLNTGATAGAHLLFNDKAGDPTGPIAGQFWRNGTKVKFYEGTLTHDLNPLTTKGDLIVHNGTTEIRVPVGTDTQVLTADSTQASGVKWAAGGAGGGDNITINGVAATDADFDDATPAAPVGDLNVKWQKDAGTPNNISGYVDVSVLMPLLTGFSHALTIEAPTDAEKFPIFVAPVAIEITAVYSYVIGASPSIDWNMAHGTDPSAAGANLFTATQTTNTTASITTDNSGFNDATLAAGEALWLTTSAKAGTVTAAHWTIYFKVS